MKIGDLKTLEVGQTIYYGYRGGDFHYHRGINLVTGIITSSGDYESIKITWSDGYSQTGVSDYKWLCLTPLEAYMLILNDM
jgi:hypothetical protein